MAKATDYSFFVEVTRFYLMKREIPPPAKNLTPSERRLLELGRVSWRQGPDRTPAAPSEPDWRNDERQFDRKR